MICATTLRGRMKVDVSIAGIGGVGGACAGVVSWHGSTDGTDPGRLFDGLLGGPNSHAHSRAAFSVRTASGESGPGRQGAGKRPA